MRAEQGDIEALTKPLKVPTLHDDNLKDGMRAATPDGKAST